jgi:hypothetical protein
MHALVGVFKMDPTRQAEQRVGLHERIIPAVKQFPGFVAGYWSLDPVSSRSHSYIVFDSGEAAERFIGFVRGDGREQSRAGVEIESLTVVEVLGEARR